MCLATIVCLSGFTSCERRSSKISRCHLNLIDLELAKHAWAVENNNSTNHNSTFLESSTIRTIFPQPASNGLIQSLTLVLSVIGLYFTGAPLGVK